MNDNWYVVFADGPLEGKIVAVPAGTEFYNAVQPRPLRRVEDHDYLEDCFQRVIYKIGWARATQSLGQHWRRNESHELLKHHYWRVGFVDAAADVSKYRGVVDHTTKAWADGEPYQYDTAW